MKTDDSRSLAAQHGSDSRLIGEIEKIEQGVVRGWLSPTGAQATLAVNEQFFAVIHEKNLATVSGSEEAKRRHFSIDVKSIPRDHLLMEKLVFELRPASGPSACIDRFEIATAYFVKPPKKSASSGIMEGSIDEYYEGRLRGWAWNRARPTHPVALLVFLDKRFAGRYIADMLRPDLLAIGKGNGRVGFNIDLSIFFSSTTHKNRRIDVYSEDSEGWLVPYAEHLRLQWLKRIQDVFRGFSLAWRLPKTSEEFVAQIMHLPVYPKKIFDIASVAEKKMPDALSADYTLLAIEFLRREAAALGDYMPMSSKDRRERYAQLQIVESQMKRLCNLAEVIAASQKVMHAANNAAAQPSKEKNEDSRRKT